jgi:type I restriction enzyme R subunit
MTKTETYEERAKGAVRRGAGEHEAAVVVDKLLTGFDAPPCTYLYIDKSMQDHGLFQALCRTTAWTAKDKDFGYIVDYKDLFKKVEERRSRSTHRSSIASAGGADPDGCCCTTVSRREKERLDQALEAPRPRCASRSSRPRASWSTSTTSAATPRSD